MYNTKAYSAASAASPLAGTRIARRDPTEHDVQIEILFCGICHSDLHTVRIDPLFNPPAPARALGASVTFEPGSRTAWHTHPLAKT